MPRALEILGLQGNGLHGIGTKANALGVESAVSLCGERRFLYIAIIAAEGYGELGFLSFSFFLSECLGYQQVWYVG